MAGVGAHFTAGGEEVDCVHPFVGCETGFAGEVVEVGDETGHEVLEAFVAALGVDDVCVGGDVLVGEVEHGGDFDGGGVHCGCIWR